MEKQDRHNISKSLIFQDSVVQCRSGPWFPTVVTSKQELLILPHNLSAPAVVSVVCVARSFVFCVLAWRSLFVRFLLAIVLSFLLRFTFSDYFFLVYLNFLCSLFAFVAIRTIGAHTLFTLSFCASQEMPVYLLVHLFNR
jgi:hypothetical protein